MANDNESMILDLEAEVHSNDSQIKKEAERSAQSWTARFNEALAKKSSGKRAWFQDIEIPYGHPKLLKKLQGALKLTDKDYEYARQDPKKSKWSGRQASIIVAAKEQLAMYKKVTSAVNEYNKKQADFQISDRRRSERIAERQLAKSEERKLKEQEAAEKEQERIRQENIKKAGREQKEQQKVWEEANKRYEKYQEAIQAQRTKQDLKDFYNQGRNEMAVQEYKELVAQYKQLERLGKSKGGAEKVQAQYASFKRWHRGKDFAPPESLAKAMARVQGLESILPTSVVDKLVNGVAKLGSKLNVIRHSREEIKGIGKESDTASISTKKLNRQLERIGSKAKRGLKAIGAAALKPVASGFSRITSRVKGLASMFSRTFRYRLIRNLVTNIIRLMKEGFTNLDKYSQKFGTPFHKNVIELRTSLTYLKNAFAAMAAPLINYVTPALTKFMDTIASAANHVGAFFAAITGQEQFSAALRRTVKDAEKTRQKLKDILGFDEINRLSGDTGESEEAYRMFEEWDPESGNFFARIRAILGEDKNWKRLGDELSSNINEAIKRIDSTKLGSEVGHKINSALEFGVSFIEGLGYTSVGHKLADFISSSVSSINWSLAGKGFARLITALPDFLIGLIEKLDYKSLGKAIGNFIGSALSRLAQWISERDWEKTGVALADGLINLINGLDTNGLIGALGKLLEAVIKAAWSFAKGVFKRLWNEFVAETLSRYEDLLPPETLKWLIDKLSFDIPVDVSLDQESVTNTETKSKELRGRLGTTLSPIPQKVQMDSASYAKVSGEATSLRSSLGEKFSTILQKLSFITPPASALKTTISETQKAIESLGGFKVSTKVSFSTVSLAAGWEGAQKALNKNPLEVPTVIQGYGTKALTSKLSSAQQASLTSLRALRFADGGVVNKGQLFIANEAGPELVGNVGGKTTVTNQDQFTQGLRDANTDVVAAVLQVVSAVNGKSFDIYMDAQKVGKSVTNYQNNMTRRNGRAVTI